MIIQNRFPLPVDAYSMVANKEAIPYNSVVITPDGKRFIVERQNGFGLSAYAETNPHSGNWLKVDLRDRNNIVYVVSITVWVEQMELIPA